MKLIIYLTRPTRDAGGLIHTHTVHMYNLLHWVYKIGHNYNQRLGLNQNQMRFEQYTRVLQQIKVFINKGDLLFSNSRHGLQFPCFNDIEAMLLVIKSHASTTEKARISAIIEYVNHIYCTTPPESLCESLVSDRGKLLFSDNG